MEEKKTRPTTPSWGNPASAQPAAPGAKPASKPETRPAKPAATSKPAAAPAAPAEQNTYTQWYEVKPGDTLWKIAKQYYGDGSLYNEIFKANQDVLKDPDKIQV